MELCLINFGKIEEKIGPNYENKYLQFIELVVNKFPGDPREVPGGRQLIQEIQTEIVLQTGNLHTIPLESVIHIAKDLKKKISFLPSPVNFSRGGGKSVSEMLSSMSENDAAQYLNKI